MRIKFLFLSLLCIWSFSLVAQTGPGGVGSGSTNVVWLKADELTGLTNGDDILTWSDASGNSNTFTAPSSTFSPVYQTGVINGLPVVRFNKSNGRVRRTSFTGFSYHFHHRHLCKQHYGQRGWCYLICQFRK